jgi:hypothetical protein
MATAAQKAAQTVAAINRASTTASNAIPGWNQQAYNMLQQYIVTVPGLFCADMVREWATQQGLPEPPSRLAWGGVFLKASRSNLIERAGVMNYHYPNSNRTHTQTNTFWRAVT